MRPLIIANWKMNPPSAALARSLARSTVEGIRGVRGVDVVIASPYPHLHIVQALVRKDMALGAQDVAAEPKGAFTGEVSALMLRDAGVRFVIVGHSERRRLFGDTDAIVNQKMKLALAAGLVPVLAIGEDSPDAHDVVPRVLADQLAHALAGIPKRNLGRIVVAYEPVWAIGTGKADTPDNATRRAIYIRKLLVKMAGLKIANSIRILYGGSVNAKNAAPFLASDIRGMDGLLVGGASLDGRSFGAIVKAIGANNRSRT